jgi:hypothetical protein
MPLYGGFLPAFATLLLPVNCNTARSTQYSTVFVRKPETRPWGLELEHTAQNSTVQLHGHVPYNTSICRPLCVAPPSSFLQKG